MNGRSFIKVATAAYPIDWLGRWDAYREKLEAWVRQAGTRGAELLVFPEYAGIELVSLFGKDVAADLERQVDALADLRADIDALHANLAATHGVHILAGSLPERVEPGYIVNRVRLFTPNGAIGVHDKQIITPWEQETWGMRPGAPLSLFVTRLGRIGILICYDAEFPLLARALIEVGADLLLVPACTDTVAGYHRMRIAGLARALEGQCFVAHASTVGEASWSPVVDVNIGAGAIYAPADKGFPDDGVLAAGRLNEPGWVVADLDLEALRQVRVAGEVRGFEDWPRQTDRLRKVVSVDLQTTLKARSTVQ